MKRLHLARLSLVLAIGICLLGAAPALGQMNQMIDLGTLGGTSGTAYGLNDLGQIVGQSTIEGGPNHAFLYTGIPGVDGQMHDLGTLGGTYSRAYGINNNGWIVGRARTAEEETHAFLYVGVPGAGGQMYDLGTLGGTYSEARAINSSGQIVGYSETGDGFYHAFLYTGVPGAGGSMVDLGTLGGNSYAYGINDHGVIVGQSEIVSGTHAWEKHAFQYVGVPGAGGAMYDLGTMVEDNYYDSGAYAINSNSQIVGWSMINANPSIYHAFLIFGGAMKDLGTLGGGNSEAWGINGRGQIVGWATIPDVWIGHAFLYDGTMKDLGTLGGDWSRAFGINKSGQVVGEAQNAAAHHRPFLYNPPPLLSLGALSLLLLN
jgi:probable HAF family extracellular repeat protein